ncbi:ATP-binding cassette domain-containing protein [Candidatus Saccharibacteria bacterium]|nr:ATP-binding cassette domain-containing protein [Candidatus Saccharibacteria bacterium]
MSQNVLLRATNLSIGYSSQAIIAKSTFTIYAGDFICLVGNNGSGKSTLAKSILGFLPPLSGTLAWHNNHRPPIGYMPQTHTQNQHFPASVLEVVSSGTLGQANQAHANRSSQAIADALTRLDILALQNSSFTQLSGGQRQKVLLARALVASQSFLILDEPSNHLDYQAKSEFYHTLHSLNHDQNLTILMITHDLDAKDLIGNKVLAIEQGTTKLYPTQKYLRRFQR